MFDRHLRSRLNGLASSRDVAGLAALLRHGKPWVADAAAEALARIGTVDALTALIDELVAQTFTGHPHALPRLLPAVEDRGRPRRRPGAPPVARPRPRGPASRTVRGVHSG